MGLHLVQKSMTHVTRCHVGGCISVEIGALTLPRQRPTPSVTVGCGPGSHDEARGLQEWKPVAVFRAGRFFFELLFIGIASETRRLHQGQGGLR